MRRRPDAPSEKIVGAVAQVVGRVVSGQVGEVLIATPRGVTPYYAHPAFPDDVFEVGTAVRVLEFLPPRGVRVAGA